MADVVLFHHLQGLTGGVLALAEALRGGGHAVETPDLFDGVRPASLEDGQALAEGIDPARADGYARPGVVYAGVSWGVMAAQRLAQTRPDARGALLYEACLPVTGEWAIGPWPAGVPVQVHGMDADPFFALEGDLDAARGQVASAPDRAELFVYPGDRHLFTDASLPSYDVRATALVVERSLGLLARL